MCRFSFLYIFFQSRKHSHPSRVTQNTENGTTKVRVSSISTTSVPSSEETFNFVNKTRRYLESLTKYTQIQRYTKSDNVNVVHIVAERRKYFRFDVFPTWESRSDRPFERSNRHTGQSSLPPFVPNPDLYVSGNFTTSPQCCWIVNWVPSRSPNSLTVSVKARGYSKVNNAWDNQVKCLAEIGML